MRSKTISPLQNFFLIRYIQNGTKNKNSLEASYFCTDTIVELENTSFTGYLKHSTHIVTIPRKLKKKLIIELVMFVMLSDTDDDIRQNNISYIHHIAEGIGIGSELLYYLMIGKAHKNISRFSPPQNLDDYSEALSILEDSLHRSNLIMS